MRLSFHTPFLILGGLLLSAAPVWALQSTPPTPAQSQSGQATAQPSHKAATAKASGVNQQVADLLNTTNQDEIALGQMMQDKAQNSQVKDFAKELVSDHQNAQDKLKDVAQQSNLTLADATAEKKADQSEQTKLQNESGTTADKAFINNSITGHKKVVAQLQRLQGQVTDPQLKSYVDETLPTLQKHIADAQKIQAAMGSGTSHR